MQSEVAEKTSSSADSRDCQEMEQEPVVVQFRDVTAAAYRIKKGVKETPLEVG